MQTFTRLLTILAVATVLTVGAAGQAPVLPITGIQGGSTNNFGVDLANGEVTVSIPLRTKGGWSSSIVGTSSIWDVYAGTVPPNGVKYQWYSSLPLRAYSPIGVWQSGGWHYQDPTQVQLQATCESGDCPIPNTSTYIYTNVSIIDNTGASHPMPATFNLSSGAPGNPPTGTYITTDGSGYSLVLGATDGLFTIYDISGQGFPGSCGGSICSMSGQSIDPDSNIISTTLSGTTLTAKDALGTTALTGTFDSTAWHQEFTQFTYNDALGHPQNYTVGYTSLPIQTNFNCTQLNFEGVPGYIVDVNLGPQLMLTSVTDPMGGVFSIGYEPTPNVPGSYTGRIASITYPSGGSITYTYEGGNNGINCYSAVVPTLVIQTNDHNQNTGTWTYTNTNGTNVPNNFTVTRQDAQGNQTIFYFSGEYQTGMVSEGPGAAPAIYSTQITCYGFGGNTPPIPNPQSNCLAPSSPLVLFSGKPMSHKIVYTQLGSPSTGTGFNYVDTVYDWNGTSEYGLVNSIGRADFASTIGGLPTASNVLEHFWYGGSWTGSGLNCTSVADVNIHNALCYSYITSPTTGYSFAAEAYQYNATGHPVASYLSTVPVGTGGYNNPFTNSPSNILDWISTTDTYNSNGTLAIHSDNSGVMTKYSYQSGCNNVLPTQVFYGETVEGTYVFTDYKAWDCNGGVVSSTTDINNNTTTFTYGDPLYRLTQVQYPDSSSDIQTLSYATGSNYPWTQTFIQAVSATQSLTMEEFFDGFGRTYKSQSQSDPNGTSTVDTVYNNLGQTVSISNPYYATSDPTYGSTTYTYDPIGRITAITPYYSNDATNITYFNRATQTIHQGQTIITQMDGLGNQPYSCQVTGKYTDAAGNKAQPCGLDISGTGFLQTNTFDLAGRLTQACQGAECKAFTYSLASQLLTETTPERGTITYAYWPLNQEETGSPAGAVATRTAPAENSAPGSGQYTTTTYCYEEFFRLSAKLYDLNGSGGDCELFGYDPNTSNIVYYYDWASFTSNGGTVYPLSNSNGRLSQGIVAADTYGRIGGVDVFYGYDAMGKTTTYGQCPELYNCWKGLSPDYYVTNYDYNFLGEPLHGSSQDGTQSTWANTYNTIGQLTGIQTYINSTTQVNLVSGIQYNALGEPTVVPFYNGATETSSYDHEGRLTKVSVSNPSPSLPALYSFSVTYTPLVTAATDQINGGWSYTYDVFGRLATGANGGLQLGESYDRWGNRWNQTVTGGTQPPPVSLTFNTNNQVTNSGYSYDGAGNLINDGTYQYKYDAEGRVIGVSDENGTSLAVYWYNTRGERVCVGCYYQTNPDYSAGTVNYLFDLDGNLVNSLVPDTSTSLVSEIYEGGRHWGSKDGSGNAYILWQDWVGSMRAWLNLNNSSVGTCTNFLWGEDFVCSGTGLNNAANKYELDLQPSFAKLFENNEVSLTGKGFTGINKSDSRQQAPIQGRWLVPDPSRSDWNAYAYAGNNPIMNTDSIGLDDGTVAIGISTDHPAPAEELPIQFTCGGGLTPQGSGVGCTPVSLWPSQQDINEQGQNALSALFGTGGASIGFFSQSTGFLNVSAIARQFAGVGGVFTAGTGAQQRVAAQKSFLAGAMYNLMSDPNAALIGGFAGDLEMDVITQAERFLARPCYMECSYQSGRTGSFTVPGTVESLVRNSHYVRFTIDQALDHTPTAETILKGWANGDDIRVSIFKNAGKEFKAAMARANGSDKEVGNLAFPTADTVRSILKNPRGWNTGTGLSPLYKWGYPPEGSSAIPK